MNGKVTQRPADQELELRELDGDFDGFLVDYKAKGHAVEYVGREKAGGIDTYKLKVTLKSGAVRHVYLDATTFLERKQEGTMTLPDGKVPVILTFGDWRDVEGVKFPFAIDEERVSFPPQTFAIYTERIELNPPVDEAMFKMPGKLVVHNSVRVRSPSQCPPRRDPDSRGCRLGGHAGGGAPPIRWCHRTRRRGGCRPSSSLLDIARRCPSRSASRLARTAPSTSVRAATRPRSGA